MEVSNRDAAGGLSLPDDIIFDVLSRLPARTLCRFRCVCKRWRALLSDPAFIAEQSSRAGPLVADMFTASPPSRGFELRVMALYGGGGEALRSFRVSFMQLANTRLDLICVDQEWDGATVVDPASGRMLAAGAKPVHHGPAALSVTEVSDISFGRAAPSGAYKLVRIRESVPPGPNGAGWHWQKFCDVATIKMDVGDAPPPPVRWRRRPAAPFLTSFSSQRKASVNGALYFLHRECADLDDREFADLDDDQGWMRSRDLIAVFDLESESWKKAINRPPSEEEKPGTICDGVTLGELKGALIMLHRKLLSHGSSDWCYATVWLLADHRKSVWVKQYAIEMPMNWSLSRALDVLGDGRVLLLNLLREEEEDADEEIRRIRIYKKPRPEASLAWYHWERVHPFAYPAMDAVARSQAAADAYEEASCAGGRGNSRSFPGCTRRRSRGMCATTWRLTGKYSAASLTLVEAVVDWAIKPPRKKLGPKKKVSGAASAPTPAPSTTMPSFCAMAASN